MRRVFVSSTTIDLAQYRQEAEQIIDELRAEYQGRFHVEPRTMDSEGQTGEREPAEESSMQWVNTSDWIVLIVAWNYGYVAPGQELSVTELEYRHSQEGCQPRKKCFVYLAGEVNDGEKAYQRLSPDREKIDLARWLVPGQVQMPAEHREKLKRFKDDLRRKRYEIFSNLDDFRSLLKRSLKKRIEHELHPYDVERIIHDGRLLQVLRGLERPIRSCIEEVKLLATLKRIHDRLHKIRQFGIRRWREEVLTQWHEGRLSSEAQATFYRGLATVNLFRGELTSFLLQLPGEPVMPAVTPKDQVQRVLQSRFDTEDGAEDLSDRIAFEKATDLFSSRVQTAFSAINSAMLERAGVLRCCYEDLLHSLVMFQEPAMVREDKARLNRDREALKERHDGLQSVLSRHNYWQQMHDKLEQLDNCRGSSYFSRDLEGFLDNCQAMICLLADADDLSLASGHMERWQDKIGAVRRYLKAVNRYRDEPSYDRMRKAFDELFYDVDIETLSSVEASERSASDFEMELEELLSQVHARFPAQSGSG
jgi:hypothetical protein